MTGSENGVLVGYDGSADSNQALSWAARQARLSRSVLTVCHAWAVGFTVPRQETAISRLACECGEQVITGGMRRAGDGTESAAVRSLLIEGPAAAVLCEESHRADLVVVGSRGHGGVAGQLLGSVSSQVAACSAAPVVVVRGHWRPAAGYAPGPIAVGADGSAASRAAVEFAFEQASLRDSFVLAICALADAPGCLAGARGLEEEFQRSIDESEKAHPGTPVVRHVAIGSPREELMRAAREAQLLVVGSRGRCGMEGMLLGSVSQALICLSPCPVGVVHPR